ncbi:MAG: glycoside hydrolase family 3 N-terminal domain-containing protein, partial [Faecousia sp.]
MRGRLIAAIFVAVCALIGLVYLARTPSVPTMAPAEPTEEASTVKMPQPVTETAPTQPSDPIEELLASMTLEEKVGQIFLARCPETDGAGEVSRLHLGGLLLFSRDFDGQTPDSMGQKVLSYQEAARIPLLIAVDEEGGTVTRVSSHRSFRAQSFSSPRQLYQQGGMELVLQTEAEKAQLLASLGINVNLAPVCDISTERSAFMFSRSLGQSPEVTGEFAAGAIQTMAKYGVGAVMKHFPGYGNNADTHVGIAVDRRNLEDLEKADLQPFFAGIEAGGGAILVSHTVVEAIDPEFPASLSPELHRYLRLAMDFDGVILTDDLSMDAISQRYGAGEAAVLAVLAGNDLLC